MRLLYLSYWGINDPLSVSTVLPHVKILTTLPKVEQVILCSLEREGTPVRPLRLDPRVRHLPISSGLKSWNKVVDFLKVPGILKRIAEQENIDKVICRSSMAGSLGYLAFKNELPFYVESFEPHAEYMQASGTWKKQDPRYILQKRWQEAQKANAAGLMTVSNAYKQTLISEGVDQNRLKVVPCVVNQNLFRLNREMRYTLRSNLGITENEIVGIYTGKLGGLYYYKQALRAFAYTFTNFQNFRLLVLTPNEPSKISRDLNQLQVNNARFHIAQVAPDDIPAYLSASDFGYCFHRSHSYSNGFGPVKNGEYWAMGLPVVIPKNIGDDSALIEQHGAGVVLKNFDLDHVEEKLGKLFTILHEPNHRDRIRQLAIKYRSLDRVQQVYTEWFGDE